MDMQRGVKCLVLPMDSSFTGALKEIVAYDSIFTSASNSWLCINALLAQLALKQKNQQEKKSNTTTLALLFSLALFVANNSKVQ